MKHESNIAIAGNMQPPEVPRTRQMTEDEKQWAREDRWAKLSIPELFREAETVLRTPNSVKVYEELTAYTAKRQREQEAKQVAVSKLDPIPAKPAKG